MIHKIQLKFHKSKAKIRLFLGGNRCLAAGTLIYGPNGIRIPIERLKPGDTVLSVCPDTLVTAPCQVEAVFDNGLQDVTLYEDKSYDGESSRLIKATPNHHILTNNGLECIGMLRDGDHASRVKEVYFAGVYTPIAHIMGWIFPWLGFDGYRPVAKLSSRVLSIVQKLIQKYDVKSFVKRDKLGNAVLYGELSKFANAHCRDKGRFLSYIQSNWNNDAIKAFMGGFLGQRMTLRNGMPSVHCIDNMDVRFCRMALTSMGITPTNVKWKNRHRWMYIKNPREIKLLADMVPMGKVCNRLRSWAVPRLRSLERSGCKWLKYDRCWRFHHNNGMVTTEQTYDLKLVGGHNLYVANGFIVGNSGKTEANAMEIYWWSSGTHPYRDDIPVPNNGRIIVESLDHFEQVMLPKLQHWAPNYDKWVPIKGHQGKIAGFKLPNGSRFRVYTFDQSSSKLEGEKIAWCAIDEPPPKEHVIASTRGLVDSGGSMWFSLTPLSEPYLFEEYVTPGLTGENPNIEVIEASIYDNPWLDKKNVDEFLATLDPDEREAREKGKFRHLVGKVFKDFDVNTHVITTAPWSSIYPVTVGVDPHLREAHKALFLGANKKGWLVALDEVSCPGSPEDLAWEIVEATRRNGFDIHAIVCDSFINQPDMERSLEPRVKMNRVFSEAGLPNVEIAKKRGTLIPLITEIKSLLKIKPWPMWGVEGPSLYIMDRCRELISNMNLYVYRENRRQEVQGLSDAPIKRHDHLIDCLRYALMGTPDANYRPRVIQPKVPGTYSGRSSK